MNRLFLLSLLILLGAARPAIAVAPQTWLKASQAAFEPGRFEHLSLSETGELGLLPVADRICDGAGESLVWSLALSPSGELYAGTGPRGKILRRSASGGWDVLFETGEVAVTSLVCAQDGTLYAGTIPSGNIYRLRPGEKHSTPVATGHRYVWALALDGRGGLLAATGLKARVLRYDTAAGVLAAPKTVLESPEEHILCLQAEPDGSVLAGSSGHGFLYRIDPAGKPDVFFDAPQQEIRALARSGDKLYVAAQTGLQTLPGSRPAPPPPAAPITTIGTPVLAPQSAKDAAVAPASTPPLPPPPPAVEPLSPAPVPSRGTPRFGRGNVNANQALFVISASGLAQQILSTDQEVLLSLVPFGGGVLAGTGNSGRTFLVAADGALTRWAHFEENQVLAMLPLADGSLAVATGNPGRIYKVSPSRATAGQLVTEVLDAGRSSRWGRLSWVRHGGGKVSVFTRSGNSERPDSTWSDWSGPLDDERGSPVPSPAARYLQARVRMEAIAAEEPPVLDSLEVVYLPANAPPSIDAMELSTPYIEPYSEHREPSMRERERQAESQKKRMPLWHRRLRWSASDPNRDDLSAVVHVRGVNERTWRLLAAEQPTGGSELDFDARHLPDGVYRLRLTVTDAWSNPAGMALSASLVSAPFTVDFTPPVLSRGPVAPATGGVLASFTAQDATSSLLSFEYLVDTGDWTPAAPRDGLADSPSEELELRLEGLAPGEHSVSLRARDEHGNVASSRFTVEVK